MKLPWLLQLIVIGPLFGCAAPESPPAWPPIEDQRGAFGGWASSGLGISIQCSFTADPHIAYFVVTRKYTGTDYFLFKGGAEVFLARTLESMVTPLGESPLVILGEFHSETQLVFAVGATEATGASAAAQFQRVLPPGVVPTRISSESDVDLLRLGVLLGSLPNA